MPENWSTFLSSQSGQLILLVGALTLAFLVLRASVAKLQKIVAETETEADDTILSFVRKFYGIVLGTILLIGVLRIFNVDVSPLLASAGIAGIVIGLAVKEVVADMLAGVSILADRPFAERDRIQVEKPSGHWGGWGDVKKIGLRRTRVLNTDGVVVNYPNSELIQSTIINFSDTNDHHDPVRVRVRFCVDWSADLDKVSALAEEAIVRGIQKAAGLAKPLRGRSDPQRAADPRQPRRPCPRRRRETAHKKHHAGGDRAVDLGRQARDHHPRCADGRPLLPDQHP